MTDEMTVVTEILQAAEETRQRKLTPEDYLELFGGMEVSSAMNSDGTFTHTVNPGGPPPTTYVDPVFESMFREQMRAYTPLEYQRQLMGVPSTFLEEPDEVELELVPNVWERLKTWLSEAQTQTINVTRTPRTTYDPTYLAAMCTANRNAITGNPRRGGHVFGQIATAVIHEDYDRMIREGQRVPAEMLGGVPPQSAQALEGELGMMRGVRFVRSRPDPDEAEARWAEGVGIGELNV